MPNRTRRAFTLIELLIVIIIMAVVAGVAVPAYARWYEKTRYDTAVSAVMNLFAYAREQAVARDATATLAYDPTTESFQVNVSPSPRGDGPVALAKNSEDPPPEPRAYIFPDEKTRVAQFSVGSATGNPAGQTGATQVRFRSDGTTDGADVTLINAGGYQSHLIVWPATGRVTLEDQ